MKFELPARSSGKSNKYIENLENLPPLVHLEIIKNKEILIDIEMTDTFYNEFEDLHNSFDIVESALKALEIIKQKEVCIYLLNECDTVEQYNNSMDLFDISKKDRHKYHLTKEEYDLLKKV